jgi:dTDP-4-dehydrorhamnose reductase
MRILVTGTDGNVGSQLLKVLSTKHDVTGINVQDLDITDFAAVKNYVTDFKPELIINPAAWTDVDGCAKNPEKAILINGYGAQNLSIAAYENDAAILQIGSNEVFDGKSNRPYYEYDAMNPVNPYGYSKYVGEQAVRESNPRHYIVRLSWLFAHGGRNFLQAILGAAQAGKSLRVVVDEVANPTYNDDLAEAIAQLIETERYGIYHLCNAGTISRYQFARYVLDKAGLSDTPIEKISRYEWPRPSSPPVYSGLANIAAKSLGITLRDWCEAVDDFLEKEGLVTGEQVD